MSATVSTLRWSRSASSPTSVTASSAIEPAKPSNMRQIASVESRGCGTARPRAACSTATPGARTGALVTRASRERWGGRATTSPAAGARSPGWGADRGRS